MESSLKEQTELRKRITAEASTAKMKLSSEAYLASIKEYKPEKIDGYTYAF